MWQNFTFHKLEVISLNANCGLWVDLGSKGKVGEKSWKIPYQKLENWISDNGSASLIRRFSPKFNHTVCSSFSKTDILRVLCNSSICRKIKHQKLTSHRFNWKWVKLVPVQRRHHDDQDTVITGPERAFDSDKNVQFSQAEDFDFIKLRCSHQVKQGTQLSYRRLLQVIIFLSTLCYFLPYSTFGISRKYNTFS